MTINTLLWMQRVMSSQTSAAAFDFTATTNLASKTKTSASVKVSLQVPGQHNVRNALAVLAIVGVLGLSRKRLHRLWASLAVRAVALNCVERSMGSVSSMITHTIPRRSGLRWLEPGHAFRKHGSGLSGSRTPTHVRRPSSLILRAFKDADQG